MLGCQSFMLNGSHFAATEHPHLLPDEASLVQTQRPRLRHFLPVLNSGAPT